MKENEEFLVVKVSNGFLVKTADKIVLSSSVEMLMETLPEIIQGGNNDETK